MSDEADSKSEKMNDLESKHDDSKSENESDPSPEPVKANNKVGKKKAAAAPKIKIPAKKRVKEAEKEAEKDAKEEERKKESKKKVEESEEDNEEDEDEEIEDDKKNGVKKGVPLLDQPLEITGSRERKQVQRFSVIKSEIEEQKVIEIPEGSGKALGTIPRINHNLERYKVENLKLLHKVCFNRTGKVPVIKKNIRKFNGFDFDKDSTDYEKKRAMLSKFGVKDLKTICMILDLERTKKKDDLVEGILQFIIKPEDSGKPLPEGRSKRKNATLKTYDESDVELEINSDHKKKKSQKTKGKKKNLKEESDSGSEKDEEEMDDKDVEDDKNEDNAISKSENESELDEEEYEQIASATFVIPQDEPKKKKTKKAPTKTKEKKTAAPPKKRAAVKRAALAKKKKVDESDDDDGEAEEEDNAESGGESDEADDAPLAKKGKAPPTDDEIKAYVKSILEGANLEEITMKTVCKQVYSHYPEFDLGHKKDFIKTTVKSLISS